MRRTAKRQRPEPGSRTCAFVLLLLATVAPALAGVAPTPPTAPGAPDAEQRRGRAQAQGRAGPPRTASPEELDALRIQVALDRAGFSPGAIDGRTGAFTRLAQAAYEQHQGSELPMGDPLTSYVITDEDVAGPFAEIIPPDLVRQAALPALAYTSVVEALSERFHCTPALLRRLNPEARFAPGETIQVPNVDPLVVPVERTDVAPSVRAAAKKGRGTGGAATPGRTRANNAGPQPNTLMQRPDVLVTVSKRTSALSVTDASGRMIFFAPVTTGSRRDPLPLGEWKVNGTQFNPVFNYNPDLFWDADPSHSKARIPSGPNNPVGLVWIDLNKPHYGIHGTPEPAAIGRAASHGCVRMTNWDALKLAGMVKPGTRVLFTD